MTVLNLNGGGITEILATLTTINAHPVMRHDRAGREYWSHRCAHPDHDDNQPSATLTTTTNGTVLFNCFTCAPHPGTGDRHKWVAQILARLRDGTPKPEPTGHRAHRGSGGGGAAHGTKTAHYDYTTPDGSVVARKVRFQDGDRKTFLWQRPFGDSGVWADGLRGKPLKELPLYGVGTITPGNIIYIVEGEKDCERLHSEGVAAVTAAGTQPGDIPDDLTPLLGNPCVVIADRDPHGIKLAKEWARKLTEQGATVVLAQPATAHPKADVTDHLNAGHPLTALQFGAPGKATTTEPEPPPPPTGPLAQRINWVTAYNTENQQVDWLVEGIIEKGRLISLYSAPKAGKSLLALDIAASLATGRGVLGQPPTGEIIPILYTDYENTQTDIVDRLKDLGYLDPEELTELHYLSLPVIPPLDTEQGGAALIQAAEETRAQLVIIDTASRTISGEENSADTWTRWYQHTGMKFKRAGIAVLRLDHSGKDAKKGQRGSSAKAGDVDLVLKLTANRGVMNVFAEERRQSYYADLTVLKRLEERGVLRHQVITPKEAIDGNVKALTDWLQAENVPPNAPRRAITPHIAANYPHRVTARTIEAAMRHRRETTGTTTPTGRFEPAEQPTPNHARNARNVTT